jgi:hypothetical protein
MATVAATARVTATSVASAIVAPAHVASVINNSTITAVGAAAAVAATDATIADSDSNAGGNITSAESDEALPVAVAVVSPPSNTNIVGDVTYI